MSNFDVDIATIQDGIIRELTSLENTGDANIVANIDGTGLDGIATNLSSSSSAILKTTVALSGVGASNFSSATGGASIYDYLKGSETIRINDSTGNFISTEYLKTGITYQNVSVYEPSLRGIVLLSAVQISILKDSHGSMLTTKDISGWSQQVVGAIGTELELGIPLYGIHTETVSEASGWISKHIGGVFNIGTNSGDSNAPTYDIASGLYELAVYHFDTEEVYLNGEATQIIEPPSSILYWLKYFFGVIVQFNKSIGEATSYDYLEGDVTQLSDADGALFQKTLIIRGEATNENESIGSGVSNDIYLYGWTAYQEPNSIGSFFFERSYLYGEKAVQVACPNGNLTLTNPIYNRAYLFGGCQQENWGFFEGICGIKAGTWLSEEVRIKGGVTHLTTAYDTILREIQYLHGVCTQYSESSAKIFKKTTQLKSRYSIQQSSGSGSYFRKIYHLFSHGMQTLTTSFNGSGTYKIGINYDDILAIYEASSQLNNSDGFLDLQLSLGGDIEQENTAKGKVIKEIHLYSSLSIQEPSANGLTFDAEVRLHAIAIQRISATSATIDRQSIFTGYEAIKLSYAIGTNLRRDIGIDGASDQSISSIGTYFKEDQYLRGSSQQETNSSASRMVMYVQSFRGIPSEQQSLGLAYKGLTETIYISGNDSRTVVDVGVDRVYNILGSMEPSSDVYDISTIAYTTASQSSYGSGSIDRLIALFGDAANGVNANDASLAEEVSLFGYSTQYISSYKAKIETQTSLAGEDCWQTVIPERSILIGTYDIVAQESLQVTVGYGNIQREYLSGGFSMQAIGTSGILVKSTIGEISCPSLELYNECI